MNLHEYQAKQLLKEYDLPVAHGEVASSLDEAINKADKVATGRWVVKAQVHAGGRGKAGGVKVVSSKDELKGAIQRLLGMRLVTYQTSAAGQPINQVLIEEPCDIAKELYLGAVIDRSKQRIVFMASSEGGVEIEKVAEDSPEKILTFVVHPLVGVMPHQARQMGYALNLGGELNKQFSFLLSGLGRMFKERDLSLLEINPLVITKNENLLCLDAKINIDDNALYRQPRNRAQTRVLKVTKGGWWIEQSNN